MAGKQRTKLTPAEEKAFQSWFANWADHAGLDPNPDHPLHKYDYRGAYKSGASPEPDITDNMRLHWPSEFKDDDHPTRFVGGVDTKTGKKVKE